MSLLPQQVEEILKNLLDKGIVVFDCDYNNTECGYETESNSRNKGAELIIDIFTKNIEYERLEEVIDEIIREYGFYLWNCYIQEPQELGDEEFEFELATVYLPLSNTFVFLAFTIESESGNYYRVKLSVHSKIESAVKLLAQLLEEYRDYIKSSWLEDAKRIGDKGTIQEIKSILERLDESKKELLELGSNIKIIQL